MTYNLIGDFMNINISSILQGSMKILNVVNKTLPLVREFNPTFTKVLSKFRNPSIKINNNLPIPTNARIQDNQKKLVNNTNSLTFFR